MGQNNSQGGILTDFISDYKVIQEIKKQNMAFLEHQ